MDIKKVVFQVYKLFPENIKKIFNNIEKKFFYILKSQFTCINLVTREEFDNNQNFLIYTSKKIEEIENRIISLEKIIENNYSIEKNRNKE